MIRRLVLLCAFAIAATACASTPSAEVVETPLDHDFSLASFDQTVANGKPTLVFFWGLN